MTHALLIDDHLSFRQPLAFLLGQGSRPGGGRGGRLRRIRSSVSSETRVVALRAVATWASGAAR
jgi:hypothetical protein